MTAAVGIQNQEVILSIFLLYFGIDTSIVQCLSSRSCRQIVYMFYMKMLFRRGSSRSREFSIVENHPLLSYFFFVMEKWRKKGCDNIIVRDVTHYTFRLWLCYLCVNCLYEAIISFFIFYAV